MENDYKYLNSRKLYDSICIQREGRSESNDSYLFHEKLPQLHWVRCIV